MIEKWLLNNASKTASKLTEINKKELLGENISGFGMKNKVVRFIDLVRTAMFPSIYLEDASKKEFLDVIVCDRLQQAAILLYEMTSEVMVNKCTMIDKGGKECDGCTQNAKNVTIEFMDSLPEITEVLNTDIQAAYEGDPAALSKEEILLSYPAFEAISIFRLAHKLFTLKVPLLPRIMTEYAHSMTGIDIHPGATVGNYFFIDHGTGVVIGETAEIGDECTLYQGVTLGGTGKDKGKRHPTLGNNVMVGCGAKVLGPFRVGDNVKIAANAVVLEPIEDNSTAVGVPARVVTKGGVKVPLHDLDQVHIPDPVSQEMCKLLVKLEALEKRLDELENRKGE